ncbi:MAG: hypothetical protein COB90_10285 [Hyphomicrobiales bacterium]|nr:MAG: hypothetical protein COB90_10285 [Hyphomicrobiales bacterium]
MIQEKLKIDDDVYDRGRGHQFYLNMPKASAFHQLGLDKEYRSNCIIFFGEEEKYSGKCLVKLRNLSKSETILIVLIANTELDYSHIEKYILLNVTSEMSVIND